MVIERLTIKNFKAIEEMSIEFQPGMNLLIGDNGVGKTSVLEAIAVALGGYLAGIPGVSARNILQEDIRIKTVEMGKASMGIKYCMPVEIGCDIDIDGIKYQWHRSRTDFGSNAKTKMDDRGICKYAQEITNSADKILPLLSFQSEARVWQTHRGDFGKELKKKLNDRRRGYIGSLDYSLDIKGIQEWCLKMEMEAFLQGQLIDEYETFKEVVSSFMQKMNGMKAKPEIHYSRQMEQIVYRENTEELPISYLSAGYQSLLWMIMDLAYRMAVLNPNIGSNIEQVTGIVVIDEIDMHLHPKWQWKVVDALKETFPNVQFIMATHSPMVISSCKNCTVINITDLQEIRYMQDSFGYSVQDVLQLRQGSDEKPAVIKELTDKFEVEMNREEFDKAESIIDQMIDLLGKNHSEVKQAKAELEASRWVEGN